MEKPWRACALLSVVALAVFCLPAAGMGAGHLTIETVTVHKDGAPIEVCLNGAPQSKVIRLGPTEWLVALQPVVLAGSVPRTFSGSAFFKTLQISLRPQKVVTLELTTSTPLNGLEARWQPKTNLLQIVPVPPVSQSPPKRPAPPEPAPPSAPAPQTVPPKHSGAQASRSKATGSLDDFFIELALDPCTRHPEMTEALSLCRQSRFEEAASRMGRAGEIPGGARCQEAFQCLKAFIAYKRSQESGDPDQVVRTINTLQQTTSFYPSTPYLPYLLSAMGKLYLVMGNQTEANGYFKVVLSHHPGFSARPEILLEHARIQIQKKSIKQGVTILEKIMADYPESSFATEARIELAVCLYDISDYVKALKHLNDAAQSDPQKVYASPKLLRYMGDSHYQLGEYDQAREFLSLALNLFPGDPEAHMLLTRIGDIYKEQGFPQKAHKIYRLVMKKYPETDGYAISSMRLAGLLADPREKAVIYNEIISRYPENPLAEFAALRLAELHHAEGQYEQGVNLAAGLLKSESYDIRQEALFNLREAYLNIFRKQMDQGNYPAVLTAYEKEKALIQEFFSPRIFHLIGQAYCQGHLFAPAADVLEQAYRLYLPDQKPPELLFDLGKALKEIGRPDKSLAMLDRYLALAPKGSRAGDVYLAKAQLLRDRKAYDDSIRNYDLAFAHAPKGRKADILLEKARVHEERHETAKIPPLLIKAIDLLASSPEDRFDRIFEAYKMLGDAYMRKEEHLKAADAFEMALKFAQDGTRLADIRFQLGQAYQKGNAMEKATSIYKAMLQSDDAFWAKLAGEKLRGMELADRLKKS